MTTATDAAAPETAVATQSTQAISAPGQTSRPLAMYETVSIEDEAAASRSEMDFYKGRKNITDRLAILGLKHIAMARSHFSDGVGSVICRSKYKRQETDGPEGKKFYSEIMTEKAGCCELLGEATKRFAVPIMLYTTNPKGEPINPFQFTLKIWRFSAERFGTLQAIHLEFKESGGLTSHDVKFKCTDDQYQKGDLLGCAESIFNHPKAGKYLTPEDRAGVENWLNVVKDDLRRAIGREVTDADIKKKLGEAGPAQTVAANEPVSGLESLLS